MVEKGMIIGNDVKMRNIRGFHCNIQGKLIAV